MRTIEDYRADLLTLLGDASGRRYSTEILDMAFRDALAVYGDYCPNKITISQTVSEVRHEDTAIINSFPNDPAQILTIRNESGDWLDFYAYAADNTKIYLTIYNHPCPQAGDKLSLELKIPHTIKGLKNAEQTTVPDAHALILTEGASATALTIRARSVTEVFGKRPEDREALAEQADRAHALFLAKLMGIARMEGFQRDPWPRVKIRNKR